MLDGLKTVAEDIKSVARQLLVFWACFTAEAAEKGRKGGGGSNVGHARDMYVIARLAIEHSRLIIPCSAAVAIGNFPASAHFNEDCQLPHALAWAKQGCAALGLTQAEFRWHVVNRC